ncbi:MAG: acetyl-CoA acetyltransferase [Acidimicrobiales bacterium]|jgi:acetyl-CoA acetyltransferase family protein|nr:acetyl-CoA acetyltransferase [Acidimicrobiales bacterium]
MGEAVIVSYARTPVTDAYRGSLANTSVVELGKVAVAEALKRSGVPADEVDDIILGEVLQGGGDLARYVALDLGLPPDTPGLAVQRQCGSGLAAVNAAAATIRAGMDKVVIAGGVESLTQSPVTFFKNPAPWGGMVQGLSESHPETPDAPSRNMMITVGENTADSAGVTREQMDEWSYHSHMRAVAAIDNGILAEEIVGVELRDRKGEVVKIADTDEHPRRTTTLEILAALPALPQGRGNITAGNSSSLNDGGAALMVVDSDYAQSNGLTPLAAVRSWAAAGVPPRDTGLAPTVAIPRAVQRAGLKLDDMQLVEINEAFASMAVACSRQLGFPHDIVNVNGGAVGIGHPVGASGARILGHLVLEMRRRGSKYGVAALCAGGGMGIATVVEAL